MTMKKFLLPAFLAALCIVSPAHAGRYGGGFSRSFSSSRSFGYRAAPRPSSGWSVRQAPSGSTTINRSTSTVVHEHNYYGGAGSSPWFWMWMMDRPAQTQIVAVPQAQNGAPAYVAEQAAPAQGGFFDTLGSIIIWSAIILAAIWLIMVVFA